MALGIHYAILAELANQVWMFSGGSIDDRRFSRISVSVKRQQDLRLLTGRDRYVADIDLPGMLEAVFVRSPMAHAGIRRIDLGAARAMHGVHATVASSDLLGVSPFPDHLRMARGVAQFPLAVDRVRYVGTPVATVVADDRLLAADASEAVIVDYETLPVVSSIEDSLAQGAPLLYDDWPDNRLLELSRETPEIDEIFARSKVVSGIYKMHRQGLAWGTSGSKALCSKYIMPILKKSQYRLQQVNPTPMVSGRESCSPIGATPILPKSGQVYPVKGEDVGFLLWRKRNCCVL